MDLGETSARCAPAGGHLLFRTQAEDVLLMVFREVGSTPFPFSTSKNDQDRSYN